MEGIAEGRAQGRAEGIAEGRAEGRAEGIAEGQAKGIAERNAEIVQAMYKQGFSIETIASITGLKEADIQSLLPQ